jgi:ATP-dependent helicase/nuclease subunit A
MVAYRKEREERAEAVRVFYVAMTRAMDRLVLLGATKNASAILEEAEMLDPVVDTDVVAARSYLDMILPLIADSEMRASAIPLSALGREPEKGPAPSEIPERLLSALDAAPRGEAYGEIGRRLTRRYPFFGALSVKSKYSVSELTGEGHGSAYFIEGSEGERLEDAGLLGIPADGDAGEDNAKPGKVALGVKKGLTAAERGSALHKAFERLDYPEAYARRGDRAYFDDFLDTLEKRRFLTREQREAVPAAILQHYAGTELFARAAASDSLRKETPFNLKWKVKDEPVIVQGVIDCFFGENGRIVLIDFKSTHIDPSRADEVRRVTALYGEQINLYRAALESILKVPADEAYLYLTNVGKTIAVPRLPIPPKA